MREEIERERVLSAHSEYGTEFLFQIPWITCRRRRRRRRAAAPAAPESANRNRQSDHRAAVDSLPCKYNFWLKVRAAEKLRTFCRLLAKPRGENGKTAAALRSCSLKYLLENALDVSKSVAPLRLQS